MSALPLIIIILWATLALLVYFFAVRGDTGSFNPDNIVLSIVSLLLISTTTTIYGLVILFMPKKYQPSICETVVSNRAIS